MSFPRYGLIRNMPGKRRILRIEGDTVHFVEEGVASRAVHRSRVTFLKDKPLPRPAAPKWEQGTLFGKSAFGVVSKARKPKKCQYCGEPVAPERWSAGYHHCTGRNCGAAWRRERLENYSLHLVPKQGFTIVPKETVVSGRSSGK